MSKKSKQYFTILLFFKSIIVTFSPHIIQISMKEIIPIKIEAYFGCRIKRSTYKNIHKWNLLVDFRKLKKDLTNIGPE